jgi:hypothetical protein
VVYFGKIKRRHFSHGCVLLSGHFGEHAPDIRGGPAEKNWRKPQYRRQQQVDQRGHGRASLSGNPAQDTD